MKYSMREVVASIICLLSVSLATLAYGATENPLPKGLIVLDGKAAPALQLKNMDGDSYDLAVAAKGHWAFVHFWASWCGPCRKEMPTIQTMAGRLSDKGLEVVLVNTAETDDTVFSFMGIVAPDLTPLLDYDGLVTQAWQPRGLPSSFLVDPDGKLRYLALGGRPWDHSEYIQFLEKLISRSQ